MLVNIVNKTFFIQKHLAYPHHTHLSCSIEMLIESFLMVIENIAHTKSDGEQKCKKETPSFHKDFLEAIRTLIPILKTEVHDQIQNKKYLQTLLKKRTTITKVPEKLFDGTRLNEPTILYHRFVDETVFTYLLCSIFCESLSQTYQSAYSIQTLEYCIPEIQAYSWFAPSIDINKTIYQLLSSTPLHPIPIYLASQIYEEALTKDEKKLLGQYYTPPILANHLLDQVGYRPTNHLSKKRILDVATGFGVFLVEATKRLIRDDLLFNYEIQTILSHISENLSGYDVNPFAIIATKMQILGVICTELLLTSTEIQLILSQFKLPHICVADTLIQPFSVDEHQAPHIVIGNPPYGGCPAGKHLQRFREVINGRANLYQLFLYFALQRCAKHGHVAFLIPESLRSGRYFTALRQYLSNNTHLIATTDFHARTSIFTNVEQGLGIFVYAKGLYPFPLNEVKVVQSTNESALPKAHPFSVPHAHIQLSASMNYVILKAASRYEYELIAKLYQLRESLQQISITAHTGQFVWNEHRNEFLDQKEDEALPVIYAHSVQRYLFSFPPERNNNARKHLLFVHPLSSAKKYAIQGEALLLQRTTAREQDWRLIATLIPQKFQQSYSAYLIENHVNFIQELNLNGFPVSLIYLLGIINSKLMNYLFTALSGTTNVSSWEIQHLPILYKPDTNLENLVQQRLTASAEDIEKLEKQINDQVYTIYGLKDQERYIIEHFYKKKHSRNGNFINRLHT